MNTAFGYQLEPWEEETRLRDKALRSGMGTKDANDFVAANIDEDPSSRVFPDFEVEEEEEEGPLDEAGDANPYAQQAMEEGLLPAMSPASEQPQAQPEAQPEVQPEVQPQVQPMFQLPDIQNAQQWMQFKNSMAQPPAQEEGPLAPPPGNPAPMSDFDKEREAHKAKQDALFEKQRNEQFEKVHGMSKEDSDKEKEDRRRRHQDFIAQRNQEWARIGPS